MLILEENGITGFIYPKGVGKECEVISLYEPSQRVSITNNRGDILIDTKQLNTLVKVLKISQAHIQY
jgi:hypothetical protein